MRCCQDSLTSSTAYRVPNSDESIYIHLMPSGTSFGYPQGSEVQVHEDRVLAIASMMLRRAGLGWLTSDVRCLRTLGFSTSNQRTDGVEYRVAVIVATTDGLVDDLDSSGLHSPLHE